MRARGRSALAAAAIAALALPALVLPAIATGQSGVPTLREAPDSGFPDRVYIYRTPVPSALSAANIQVTENDSAVSSLAVDSSAKSSGAILLIDASNSMKGAPIAGAMAAARAFMAERKQLLPVAVIAYNPEITVLTDFTTDAAQLAQAVGTTPTTAEGTHIYDALIEASELAEEKGYARTTAVLLSDGHRRGVQASRADALAALNEANVRVISVGLRSPQYDPETLLSMARNTGGAYVESATPKDLEPIFSAIGQQLSNEYVLTYRSLLPPTVKAVVRVKAAAFPAATATYTTPALDLVEGGTFERSWIDEVIISPWLMVFVIVAVIGLLVFAVFAAVDVRSRSVRRRMAQYVNVPSEEESRVRRTEVASMLAERAQRKVADHRWWQRFESDVELAGFKSSAVTLAGWTLVGGVLASLVAAIAFQSLLGLLVGLVAPLITRSVVKNRVRQVRSAFADELPDNLEVLAGALRAGHSLIGAMGVMVDGATEPSKTEFRRVLQDEQLGVPIDDALMVMAGRMDNLDVEQVALVTRLQREAGGNTAEVLDRVVDNIRGRMELKRLVRVLTAQGRIARYILTSIPVLLLVFFYFINPEWLEPLWNTSAGQFALGAWFVMLIAGWFAIKKIVDIEV
jgi:Flp pilus assembly protein TadB/Mg-chelatase subunit ChlD